ncbi:MAG: peptidase S1 [Rhodospirillaceae bacterium]|nr:peptidase S1 [Rhodospirillaceae bacterium]
MRHPNPAFGRVAAGVLAVASLLAAVPATAQNWSLQPTYGTVNLTSGFLPDPYVAQVTSSGPIDASQSIGGGCRGMVANAPDYRLNYTAGSYPLQFRVESGSDTTLVVNAPNASWYCNDDYQGLNPAVTFTNPQSGQYDIWVGSYRGDYAPASLIITEVPR